MTTPRYNTAINYLCGFIPAFILIIPASGEIAFSLLALYSFYYCQQQKINPFKNHQTKAIAFICIAYFLTALVSILASDISLYAFKRLGTNIHFLVAPWLAVLLSQQINKKTLSIAIKLGAMLAGIVALFQYFYLDQRAHGSVNALPFGCISLLLGFFSLINIHNEPKAIKALSLLSFFLGSAAVIVSLSRGAWIAVPFLLVLLIFIWYRQNSVSNKQLTGLLIIGIISISTASLSPQVQSRITEIKQDITSYEINRMTSVGVRLTLWKTAITAIPSHPIMGFGLHNTKKVIIEYVNDVQLKEHLQQFGHFHNEYLTTLVAKGGIGIISLFASLIYPCFLFYRYLLFPQSYFFSSLVLLLCTGYAFFGLTNLAFGHGIMNTFFVFFLATATHSLNRNRVTSPIND